MSYKIKVISLQRRKDRREIFANRFSEFDYEFVDALDGREYQMTDEDWKFVEGNSYMERGIHIPSLVCANKMHIKLLKECSMDDVPYVIFEDDTQIIKEIDFSFDELSKKQIDVLWFMNYPSILTYMVWPRGATKLLESIDKLDRGLDDKFYDLRENKNIIQEEFKTQYFYQRPGEDSDIGKNIDYKKLL